MNRRSVAIVGAGIHGVLALAALDRKQINSYEDVILIDPNSMPLENWFHSSRACSMEFMRSNSSHNLAFDFNALRNYTKKLNRIKISRNLMEEKNWKLKSDAQFIMPYHRPSLDLFNTHGRYVLDQLNWKSHYSQDRIVGLNKKNDGYFILQGSNSSYEADTVICAVGNTNGLNIIDSFNYEKLKEDNRYFHIFDRDFSSAIHSPSYPDSLESPICIIGAGISGSQLAIALSRSGKKVDLVNAEDQEINRFDFEPGYIGPKYSEDFKSKSPIEKQTVLDSFRYPGTISQDVHQALEILQRKTSLRIHSNPVKSIDRTSTENYEVQFADNARLKARTIILATGYSNRPVLPEFLEDLINKEKIACLPSGLPLLQEDCSLLPGLFFSGYLASAQIGPPAANIIGAYLALRAIGGAMGL